MTRKLTGADRVEMYFNAITGPDGLQVVKTGSDFALTEWWSGDPESPESRLLLSIRVSKDGDATKVEAHIKNDQPFRKLLQSLTAVEDALSDSGFPSPDWQD